MNFPSQLPTQINSAVCVMIFRPPRAHEYGGTYGQGVIVRNYNVGTIITIRVELTASHMGYFTFSVCQNYKNTTQECLDKNILKNVKPQKGEDKALTRFYPKDGNKVYEMRYKLPDTINCPHCVLQWRYISGKFSFLQSIPRIPIQSNF